MVPASVFPVRFVACRRGKLLWKEPYGGVEITFQSEVPEATHGTYQVCLTAKDSGTNIFTKSRNKFRTLRRGGDRNAKSEICINSDTKEILIYLEATDNFKTKVTVFTYRTIFKRKNDGQLRPKECKPCGQQELIKSYCAGDFGKYTFNLHCLYQNII